ncbi:MAG: helix-turn-helix domain-containing protein [Rhodocyclaceae bacterium]|nr:helix-turn-helix domain-containing protein [Rhodocyclaceae bacterium]
MSEASEACAEAGFPESSVPPTVGQTLRAAREAAGLSIADVAQVLKFSPRQIEALEADDYAALPGNTIVRGFVRSYGKLLKLDVAELLQRLDPLTPCTPADVRPPENMGLAIEEQGLRQMPPIVAAAIVLLLAALLLALWHFWVPSKPASGNGRAVTPVSPVVPQAVAPPQAEAAAATPTPAEAPPTPAAAGANAAPTESALPPPAALQFVFEGRSWIEVIDATRQVVATGEHPASSRLTVQGRPPFDIVIGNAPKVRLTYGEREVDLKPHTRAEVARFRLE